MAPQCQALNLSDESPCTEPAHNYASGLFCRFHARQAHGLYRGYKRRNAELDALVANQPAYLRKTKASLNQIEFQDIDDVDELKSLHDHLFHRYSLLDRVIRARKLHTSRFYAINFDYGHQAYIDQLNGQRASVLRALERLERRTAEVLYSKRKWFNWVRQLEDQEEQQREAEKKRVKREAALFKRHWKEVEKRMRELRKKEEEKRQQEFLDQAWQERQKELDVDDDSDDSDWDPIEDVVEDERGNYIDLIKHFLWQETDAATESNGHDADQPSADTMQLDQPEAPKEPKSKKKNAKKKTQDPKPEEPKPGDVHIESAAEMRKRLKEGEKVKRAKGLTAVGTIDNPEDDKTAPLSDREVDMLLSQVVEIKSLLFCRLLLSHAALLPAALRANSVDDFLADEQVNHTELRDLCLKMEQPDLQQIRDACADLGRGDDEGDDEDEDEEIKPRDKKEQRFIPPAIPRHFQTEREKSLLRKKKSMAVEEGGGTLVDFGDIDDSKQYVVRKVRVKVCGKWIYNYPSSKAMTRRGWLQFSVIAKDCSLEDAIHLCKSWDEFSELSALALHRYFPAGAWASWGGDFFTRQLMLMGFYPYYKFGGADEMTLAHQTARHAPGRRQHAAHEARNHICGHVKRDDAVSRRFIQYLALKANQVVVFARDGKTGRVLVQPPKDQLWLVRQKAGLGRASKNDWKIIEDVGPDFFEDLDQDRKWTLGFRDYYDICVWDLKPGRNFADLFETVYTTYIKALRCQTPNDLFRNWMPILKNLRQEPETGRIRDLFPEELEAGGLSMFDDIENGTSGIGMSVISTEDARNGCSAEFKKELPAEFVYSEADRLEDEILFPWENSTTSREDERRVLREMLEKMGISDAGEEEGDDEEEDDEPMLADQGRTLAQFETGGFNMQDFADDVDPEEDDEYSDCKDESESDEEHDDDNAPDQKFLLKLRQAGLPMRKFSFSSWDQFKKYMQDLLGGADGATQAIKEYAKLAFGAPVCEHIQKGVLGSTELEAALAFIESHTAIGTRPPHRLVDPGNDSQAMSMGKLRLASMRNPTETDRQLAYDMDNYIDKERAYAFKEGWHEADLTTDKEEFEADAEVLIAFDYWMRRGSLSLQVECATKVFEMLAWLRVTPDCDRRIFTDMRRAVNMTTLFFSASKRDQFFASDGGDMFEDSILLNQAERAKTLPPDCRSCLSNPKRPAEQWAPVDEAVNSKPDRPPYQCLPAEWDLTIRPALAYLYRGGVICPRYANDAYSCAVALQEPGRAEPDLFIDYRIPISSGISVSLPDPDDVEPLLSTAQKFATTNGADSCCFSVLTVWSAAHFWPLMIGWEMRGINAFFDTLGRCWEWKFASKDMAFTERSMHHAVSLRLAPFKNLVPLIRDRIVHRRDQVLVMGKDRQECERLTAAAIWMITTRPWRLEVAPWKSWYGVGLDLLEGLDQRWWM